MPGHGSTSKENSDVDISHRVAPSHLSAYTYVNSYSAFKAFTSKTRALLRALGQYVIGSLSTTSARELLVNAILFNVLTVKVYQCTVEHINLLLCYRLISQLLIVLFYKLVKEYGIWHDIMFADLSLRMSLAVCEKQLTLQSVRPKSLQTAMENLP